MPVKMTDVFGGSGGGPKKKMDATDRKVLETAIRFVEDGDEGYGAIVDGQESSILGAFCDLARMVLSGHEDESEKENAGAVGYGYQFFSSEYDSIVQERMEEGSSVDWWKEAGITIEEGTRRCKEWHDYYASLPGETRWETEWC